MKNKFVVLLACKLPLRHSNVIFCNGNKRINYVVIRKKHYTVNGRG